MSRRLFAVMALAMLGINAGAIPPEPFRPGPRRRDRRDVEPEQPPLPQCKERDADGRQCDRRILPHHEHAHAEGWKVRPESRQVRRARARAEAKAQRRRGRQ